MYMILIYDIKLSNSQDTKKEDSKTLRNIFNICKKYLTHIQNSVFEGELSKSQYEQLKIELNQHLRHNKDSCIIFSAYNNKWMKKEFLTKEIDSLSNFI